MIGEIVKINGKDFLVTEFIGKGKSGYSYLMENGGAKYVFKMMHHEPCSYYNFSDDKLECEIKAYNRLKDIVSIPALIDYDENKQYLIKEYIDGPVMSQVIAECALQENMLSQIFEISGKLKSQMINIDYFPANFAAREDELFYIDYEFNTYQEKWDFINWGIYYWVNSKGIKEFLKTGNPLAINIDAESGIPIKEPFKTRVEQLIEKYAGEK